MQNELQKTSKQEVRRRLAGRIAAIENHQPQLGTPENQGKGADGSSSVGRVALGIDEIDRALDPYHGKGIEFAGLHEIRSQTTLSFAAAAGFALVLGNHMERNRFRRAARLQPCETGQSCGALSLPLRPIFWIADKFCQTQAGEFYGPGLYPLGINPGRLVRVLPRNFDEAIWAAGEISRGDKVGFALLEVRGNPHKLDLTITRRLALRCQRYHAPFFILRQAGLAQASAVTTRWLVEPALSRSPVRGPDNSGFVGMAAWKVSLEKCRGGKTGDWTLEWNHHEQIFQIAGQLSGQPYDYSGNCSHRHRKGQFTQKFTRRQALSGSFTAATGN